MNSKSALGWLVAAVFGLLLSSCSGGGSPEADAKSEKGSKSTRTNGDSSAANTPGQAEGKSQPAKKKFQAVDLGDDSQDSGGEPKNKPKISGEARSRKIVEALQPFQIMLGKWRWITNRKFDGASKSGEDLEWVWDFRSDRSQPSLTAKCANHPYFGKIWLTYLPEEDKYRLTTEPVDGSQRLFLGTWVDGAEPRDESDGKKTQRTYKLQLTQLTPQVGEQWQIVFSQLDNDQYLLTMTRRPASASQYGPLDVVRQQRLGTSFAVADSDNPGPKCIISGGLGSMTVTYRGKSYPVCCTGCAAAFNEDPERWLAKLAEREKQKDPE